MHWHNMWDGWRKKELSVSFTWQEKRGSKKGKEGFHHLILSYNSEPPSLEGLASIVAFLGNFNHFDAFNACTAVPNQTYSYSSPTLPSSLPLPYNQRTWRIHTFPSLVTIPCILSSIHPPREADSTTLWTLMILLCEKLMDAFLCLQFNVSLLIFPFFSLQFLPSIWIFWDTYLSFFRIRENKGTPMPIGKQHPNNVHKRHYLFYLNFRAKTATGFTRTCRPYTTKHFHSISCFLG